MKDKCETQQIPVLLVSVLSLPEAERGSPGEEDRLGFGLRLLEEPEEGVILHADLPEDLTAIPAGHGELQRVVVGVLLKDEEADLSIDAGKNRLCERKGSVMYGLTVGSALSLIRNLLRLKLSLRTLDQLKALIFVYP